MPRNGMQNFKPAEWLYPLRFEQTFSKTTDLSAAFTLHFESIGKACLDFKSRLCQRHTETAETSSDAAVHVQKAEM